MQVTEAVAARRKRAVVGKIGITPPYLPPGGVGQVGPAGLTVTAPCQRSGDSGRRTYRGHCASCTGMNLTEARESAGLVHSHSARTGSHSVGVPILCAEPHSGSVEM